MEFSDGELYKDFQTPELIDDPDMPDMPEDEQEKMKDDTLENHE